MGYTFTEYQEPGDPCGHPPTPTEHYAIADLLMRAAKGEDTSQRAAQIAIAFPQERARAKVRGASRAAK